MENQQKVSMSHSLYLKRYAWPDALFTDYQPDPSLGLIVVIPSFKEEGLIEALTALNQCVAPRQKVLLLVVVNESMQASEEVRAVNVQTIESLKSYSSKFELLFKHIQLPEKKAGVGLARKIGMDEAVRFFKRIKKDGVIVCYDADCTCNPNYLQAIEEQFENPKTNAGIVFYEHRLDGPNRDAIINYELYLRYYIDSLRYAGFPYAHQTLGSCIVVRSSVYQKQGGMNTRKAGEDFYFLNKVIPLGGLREINETCVYPSDRISDRVPFGTGKAINDLLKNDSTYCVYHPKIFEDLRVFFSRIPDFWKEDFGELPVPVKTFLGDDWKEQLLQVKKQVRSLDAVVRRFFQWF
ncbi:MAG: glycosyltransferase, partial [Bacteroidota bacterium]